MSKQPKRVRRTRINNTNKKGGVRTGMMSGLVSTTARSGVSLFRYIRKRTSLSQHNDLNELIKNEISFVNIINRGFKVKDVMKEVGFFDTINLAIKDSTISKNFYNGLGITDDDLIMSGAKISKDGDINYDNFDIKNALLVASLDPANFILILNEVLTPIIQTNSDIMSKDQISMSLTTKFSVIAEIGNVYSDLNVAQKKKMDIIASKFNFLEQLKVLDFTFLFP